VEPSEGAEGGEGSADVGRGYIGHHSVLAGDGEAMINVFKRRRKGMIKSAL